MRFITLKEKISIAFWLHKTKFFLVRSTAVFIALNAEKQKALVLGANQMFKKLCRVSRRMRCVGFAGLIFSQGLMVNQAWGQGPSGTWFLSVDNDTLAQSDDDYTNGLQLGWVSGYLSSYYAGPVPNTIASLLSRLPLVNKPGRQRFISHSVSHRIFTPGDTETSEFIANDIPYSGLLFASLTAGAQDEFRMNAFTIHYGLVGPSAQGESVQNEFHKLIGADSVNGWDNQLRDEPLLNINYEHRRRFASFGSQRGWGGDVIGQAGVGVGNLISLGTLGIGGRFGWGVADDFGIPPQFFGEETIGSRPYSRSESQRGIWLFGLINGSLIGNAIFWDGNTFQDSPSVDHDPGIGRFYGGIAGRWGRWGASFAMTITTVPWDNPDDKSMQRYGRLGLTYSY